VSVYYSGARTRYSNNFNKQRYAGSKAKSDSMLTDDTSNTSVSESIVSTASAIYGDDITNDLSNDYDKPKSLLDFSQDNILNGIIFSEILGKPRARKNWRYR